MKKNRRQWKCVHTSNCPEIEEYGVKNKLSNYCLQCLHYVWLDSSSDWYNFKRVRQIIKYESRKIRSLQLLCIKSIIERNIEFTNLPNIIKNQIQEVKDR